MLHKNSDNSWFTFIKYIVTESGFNLNTFLKNCIRNSAVSVFSKLKQTIEKMYVDANSESSRLKLYSKIKHALILEKYLVICEPLLCKCITNLRISSHKLPVETGRYHNIPHENRICNLCKYKVGDEFHCLMECLHPFLSKMRNEYLLKIFKINPQLKYLPRSTLFVYIMSFQDNNLINLTANYVQYVLDLCRQNSN